MKTRKLILINITAAILICSPFLPGPPNGIVNMIFNLGQIIAVFSLLFIPLALIWVIKERRRKKKQDGYVVDPIATLSLTLLTTIFLTCFFVVGHVRNFSRTFAIDRAETIIQSIEQFKSKNGAYPRALNDIVPEFITDIPSPAIMGVREYYFENLGNRYNLVFQQNVSLSFNFEVVVFDPIDQHEGQGESPTLHETGRKHWKYYVFD